MMGVATIATGGGDNLLRGNSPNTTPQTGVMVDLTGVAPELPEGASETLVDSAYRAAALDWITNNPVDAIQLFVGKLAYFFAASNSFLSDVESQGLREAALWLAWVPFVLLAAGRVATWRVWPMTDLEKVAIWCIAGTALATAVFFTRVRYRITVDPFVFLLAGMLIARGLTAARRLHRAG